MNFQRRKILAAAAALWAPGAYAEQLARTPSVEEGPYYPTKLPLDTDNDLLILNNSLTPASGEPVHLSGKILDSKGQPVRNAEIEIWQVDNNGVYYKMQTQGRATMDPNFQGYGRFLTASTGEYYFRTIRPVIYPGRAAPHIHVQVRTNGHSPWTTQIFIKGHPGNVRDMLYRRLDEADRKQVSVDFNKLEDVVSQSEARFDIVLGW